MSPIGGKARFWRKWPLLGRQVDAVKRPPVLARILIWLGSLAAVGILGLTVVGIVFVVVTFSDIVQRHDQSRHWAEFTGPIGDTFGGMLGPLLNALVLGATVWLAVYYQPRRESQARRTAEHRDRAAGIVGWVAETEDKRYLGVVVTNAADSVVHNLDITVEVEPKTTMHGRLIDREAALPPGTWFIPFLAIEGSVDEPVAEDFGWKLPVPVRHADGMQVALEPLGEESTDDAIDFFLRPHLPEERHGERVPHYKLKEFRYVLHGLPWERKASGEHDEANGLSDEEEQKRERLAKKARESVQPETASRRVTPDQERLIRCTFEQLCSAGDLAMAEARGTKNALRGPIKVREGVLSGVESIERPTNGGRMRLNLRFPTAAHLWMAQVNEVYPMNVHLRASDGSGFLIDGKKADGEVKKAGARVRGLENAGDLMRPAGEWLTKRGVKQEWLETLQAMVDKASEAVPAGIVEPAPSKEPNVGEKN